MAAGTGVRQGKTAFVENFLTIDPEAAFAAVNRAWKSAGNDDSVSESLVSKTRSRLKVTGKRGADGSADGATAKPAAKGKAKPSSKRTKGEGASKAEEARTQPEGRERGTGPVKSAFAEEVLGREPKANVAAINRAWAAAGHEGKISDSIIYKAKRDLGLTGRPSSIESASAGVSEPEEWEAGTTVGIGEETPQQSMGPETPIAPAPGSETVATVDLGRVVDEVEAGIDDLMFMLKVNGGMPEVEAALRAARRLLTRSHGGD
jgi:hypothetical protein